MNRSPSSLDRLRVLGAIAAAWLAVYGAVMLWWLGASGVVGALLNALTCFAPALLGAVLAMTSTEDRKQYLARVIACLAFAPILLLFWGASQESAVAFPGRTVWPFAVGVGIGHAVAFVGFIFWGGPHATMVPAAPGVAPSDADELLARLLSLDRLGAPLLVTRVDACAATVSLRPTGGTGRNHEVTLRLDPQRARVMVAEKLSADMARPASEEESSMRGPSDSHFDPTRPGATRVSGTTLQTRMIDPQRLAALRLGMQGADVELLGTDANALDADGMVALLCAVVTRSGWRWQPVFFAPRAP